MRRAMTMLAAAGLVAFATPAGATHGGIHPTFKTEQVYFHCTGPTKLANANNAAAATPAPWDTTKPTQSVQQGAGCGALDFGVVRNTGVVDAYFKGTFTGNLRDLTFQLHNLVLSQVRQGGTLGVKVSRLLVDGTLVVDNQTATVTPVRSSSGASEYFELSVVGLGSATEIKDAEGNVIDVQTTGYVTDDGDGTTVREIEIFLDTDPSEANSAWVWDSTEVPSGIVFNPPTLAAARVTATPPEQPAPGLAAKAA